jgi:hypothetical protein
VRLERCKSYKLKDISDPHSRRTKELKIFRTNVETQQREKRRNGGPKGTSRQVGDEKIKRNQQQSERE